MYYVVVIILSCSHVSIHSQSATLYVSSLYKAVLVYFANLFVFMVITMIYNLYTPSVYVAG